MAFDFDLFVIGGGSGGVRAGRVAAETGARVGLAEEYRMGGTCVIRGCVPKKLMVFASGYRQDIADAAAYGWNAQGDVFDWRAFRKRLDAELDRLESVYRINLARPGTQIFDTRAEIEDPHSVRLASGERYSARHILVATGGHPHVPDTLEGRELAITSNDIFRLDELPGSILIVGGGYIACEFACILKGLGVSVTQFYRGAQILRGFDDEARGHIAEMMQAQGIALHVGTDAIRLERHEGRIRVTTTAGGQATFDKVLYATGRSPNTSGLGLDRAGVQLDRRGAVMVDGYSQSNIPSVYAVGDVTDRLALTPVAIREAAAFVETVFNGNPVQMDYRDVPSAVFTQPEYGSVGLTEEQAREQGPVEIYSTAFRPMKTAFIDRPERALFKLIVSATTRRVLGVHIIAPGAGEMIQLAGVLVMMGATKEDFDAAVAVHPTMAEEIVLMKRPVRTA